MSYACLLPSFHQSVCVKNRKNYTSFFWWWPLIEVEMSKVNNILFFLLIYSILSGNCFPNLANKQTKKVTDTVIKINTLLAADEYQKSEKNDPNIRKQTKNMFFSLESPFLSAIASKTSRERVWQCMSRRCWTPWNSVQRYSSPLGGNTLGDAPLLNSIDTSSLWPAINDKYRENIC